MQKKYGADGGNDLFHDSGRTQKSGSAESVQEASDCKRCRS